jgi:hypothetical protein
MRPCLPDGRPFSYRLPHKTAWLTHSRVGDSAELGRGLLPALVVIGLCPMARQFPDSKTRRFPEFDPKIIGEPKKFVEN